jgi:hypothetical protein
MKKKQQRKVYYVKCIDDSNWTPKLKNGRIYKVTKQQLNVHLVFHKYYYVSEVWNGGGYLTSRFTKSTKRAYETQNLHTT